MTAIVGGLGAAVLWSLSTLATSRSTRIVTPTSVLAWVMTIGAVLVAPFALASGVPDALGGEEVAWLVTSGLANLYGLLLSYSGLRVGKVGIVAPIASAQRRRRPDRGSRRRADRRRRGRDAGAHRGWGDVGERVRRRRGG